MCSFAKPLSSDERAKLFPKYHPLVVKTEVSEEVDTVSPPAQIRELDEESVAHLWLISKGLAGRWEHRAPVEG